MSNNRQFIIDEAGVIKSVVIDYATFHKMEEAILNAGLEQAMLEIEDEQEISLEEAMLKASVVNAH